MSAGSYLIQSPKISGLYLAPTFAILLAVINRLTGHPCKAKEYQVSHLVVGCWLGKVATWADHYLIKTKLVLLMTG